MVQWPEKLKQIALLNPKLAYLLMRGVRFGERSYTMHLYWDASAPAETPVTERLPEGMYQDAWLREMVYSVRLPTYQIGNAYRHMIIKAAQQSIGTEISVNLSIGKGNSRDREITNTFSPLCNMASVGSAKRKLVGSVLVLSKDENLTIKAYNKRAFTDEGPVYIDLTLNMFEMSGCMYCKLDFNEAVEACTRAGLLVSGGKEDA